MIEIFKTNVKTKGQAAQIVAVLKRGFSESKINFDLNDRDKILRIDRLDVSHLEVVVNTLGKLGFTCEVLN